MSIKRVRLEGHAAGEDPSYSVGYGKPPKAHQFKPGKSGNPKGRPKGSRNFATDVKAMLKAPVKVSRNGKATMVSTQKATLMRLREKALSGDVRATDRLLALAEAYNNEDRTATTSTLSADDAVLFDILVSRVQSGAISTTSGRNHNAADAGSHDDASVKRGSTE